MTSPLRTPLILSLALNLALVGIVAGHRLMGPPPPQPYHERSMDAVEVVAAQLPEEKAVHLRESMARAQSEVKPYKQAMTEVRERTTEILGAPTFDAAAYQQEASRLHELRGAMMQRMAQGTMEAAAVLDQTERALLAETFQRYHGYWKKCEPALPSAVSGAPAGAHAK